MTTILDFTIFTIIDFSIHDGHTLLGAGALAQWAALTWEPYNRLGLFTGRRSDWDTRRQFRWRFRRQGLDSVLSQRGYVLTASESLYKYGLHGMRVQHACVHSQPIRLFNLSISSSGCRQK